MIQYSKTDILANAATATSNYTGNPFKLGGVTLASIHIIFSSAGLNGTLLLQANNDPALASGNWVDVASSSQSIASGASHIWNISDAAWEAIRFTWTRTSGTGTLT